LAAVWDKKFVFTTTLVVKLREGYSYRLIILLKIIE